MPATVQLLCGGVGGVDDATAGEYGGRRRVRRRAQVGVLLGCALTVVVTVGVVQLLRPAHPDGRKAGLAAVPAPAASASPRMWSGACLVVGAARQEAEQYCLRQAADARKRVAGPGRSPAATRLVLDKVQAAVAQADWEQCGQMLSASNDVGTCVTTTITHRPAAPEDAEAIRRALAEAGYRDVVARVARPDDPAFPNSVIYAVATDGRCVIGFARGGHRGFSAEGAYPDGRCLEP